MKIMKSLVLAAAFLMMGIGWAMAGTETALPDPGINPLNVARAFVNKTPAYYQCSLGCNMLKEDSFEWMSMKFTMTKDLKITKLTVNGIEIPITEPLLGIPLGAGGLMRNVYLNVNAMTESGEYAGSGYVQAEVITKDGSIAVTLIPADVKRELPVKDLEQYDPSDLGLEIEDLSKQGYGYGWGVEDGRFNAWIPPLGNSYHYIIRQRSTGAIVAEGDIGPYSPAVASDNAHVGVDYAGNVGEIEFTRPDGYDEWVSGKSFTFNCLVPFGDTVIAGKVIIADVKSGGLEVYVSGDCDVYVLSAASSEGNMVPFELNHHSSEWGETRVSTIDKNIGKVVVAIIPKPTNQSESTWVAFHRFYGPLQ
jgi:hypothetical protein